MKDNPQYRSDIDGLRALAVLGVVFFHAGLGVPGGFAGVDVFFVISGFLITRLILKDLQRGNFSIAEFWERRVRRIFPALFVMVALCLVAGWFVLLPFEYVVLAQSAFALSLFASNIQFWRTTDYFSPIAEENLLLHTWSLSVEEQFYLLIPLLLAGLYAWKKRRLLWPALVMVTLSSFALSVWWLREDPAGAFYLMPSRAWELGVGSLLAFAPILQTALVRSVATWCGVAAIMYTFFFYLPGTAFPGLAALPPVLGTALIIYGGCAPANGKVLHAQRLLSWKPLVWCGVISYSLYLWHWPFFAFHRYAFGHLPTPAGSLCYIAVAFLLATLSFRFVERPFRERRVCGSRKAIFVFFILGTGAVVVASLMIYFGSGLPCRLPRDVLHVYKVHGNEPYERQPRESLPGGTKIYDLGLPAKQPEVLLWGDSHADVLLSMVDEACRREGVSGRAVVRGGTPPVFGWSGEREATAEHAHAMVATEAVEGMLRGNSFKVVILAFRWGYYVRREPPLDASRVPAHGFAEALEVTIAKLRDFGPRIVLMEEVPVFRSHVPRVAALATWIGIAGPSLRTAELNAYRMPYAPILDSIGKSYPEVVLLDPAPTFITGERIDFQDEQGVLLWRDQHHLTRRGAERLLAAVREHISRAMHK